MVYYVYVPPISIYLLFKYVCPKKHPIKNKCKDMQQKKYHICNYANNDEHYILQIFFVTKHAG